MSEYSYKGKVIEIEGLRGIAILLVTMHHFWPESSGFYEFFSPIVHLGWIGVDLFFVLSGFLIGGILLDTKQNSRYFKNFYIRRFLRIFPLYYLFVVSLFIIVPFGQSILHHVSYEQTEFIKESGSPIWYLLFLGNIREAITGVEPAYFLAPLWSISIEEQFYLLSPLLIYKATAKQLKIVLAVLICLSPLFRLAMFELFPDNERIQYLATISRFDNLSAGLVLAILVRSKYFISKKAVNSTLILLTIAMAVIFSLDGFNRFTFFCRVFGYSMLALYFFTFVLWTIQNRGLAITAVLRNKVLVYLGGLCYGLYLLQRPAEILLLKLMSFIGLDLQLYPTSSLVLKTLFAIFISQLVWTTFEKPINNLKEKFKVINHPINDRAAIAST
ncbi:MAG: acyltransferase family protein [Cognaticolwellia sp.]